MSLLDSLSVPTVPTAPHSRVQHLFYTAPYIDRLFKDFLEKHVECDILETDAMVKTLSAIYVLGRKIAPNFWRDTTDIKLPADKGALITQLELMRGSRSKYKGRRAWDYFQTLWNQLTNDPLPSRKVRDPITFNETEAETMVRIRLVRLVVRLVEVQLHPPPPPVQTEHKRKRVAARRKSQTDGS